MSGKGSQGKVFERQFRLSCERQGILCIRLNDSSTSFIMEKNARFTPDNPCDFITYYNGNYLFPIECKNTSYNSFSIQREKGEKNKMIKLHQINSMVNFSLFNGVYPCFIFNFTPKEDGVEEETYIMHISNFSEFLVKSDKHSINKLDIIQYGGIKVEQKLLRTNYLYNIKKSYEDIIKQMNQEENHNNDKG